jgi:hypothetical protein
MRRPDPGNNDQPLAGGGCHGSGSLEKSLLEASGETTFSSPSARTVDRALRGSENRHLLRRPEPGHSHSQPLEWPVLKCSFVAAFECSVTTVSETVGARLSIFTIRAVVRDNDLLERS